MMMVVVVVVVVVVVMMMIGGGDGYDYDNIRFIIEVKNLPFSGHNSSNVCRLTLPPPLSEL